MHFWIVNSVPNSKLLICFSLKIFSSKSPKNHVVYEYDFNVYRYINMKLYLYILLRHHVHS
jgi:hypothetical protein